MIVAAATRANAIADVVVVGLRAFQQQLLEHTERAARGRDPEKDVLIADRDSRQR